MTVPRLKWQFRLTIDMLKVNHDRLILFVIWRDLIRWDVTGARKHYLTVVFVRWFECEASFVCRSSVWWFHLLIIWLSNNVLLDIRVFLSRFISSFNTFLDSELVSSVFSVLKFLLKGLLIIESFASSLLRLNSRTCVETLLLEICELCRILKLKYSLFLYLTWVLSRIGYFHAVFWNYMELCLNRSSFSFLFFCHGLCHILAKAATLVLVYDIA